MLKKSTFLFASAVLCIALACSAGCAGYNIVKQPDLPAYTEPTETPYPVVIKTPIHIEATPNPGQILSTRSYHNSAWDKYTSTEDRFTVETPYNWRIRDMNWNSANTLSKGSITKDSSYMDKIIFIYTPDTNGFLIIYGMNSYLNLESAGGVKFIPDSTYNYYVNAAISGYTNDPDYSNIRYVKDTKLYLINGNPARALTIYTELYKDPMTTEVYFIDTDNGHYIVAYVYTDDVNAYYSDSARNIMNSFKSY
jgi:hypothetical protein